MKKYKLKEICLFNNSSVTRNVDTINIVINYLDTSNLIEGVILDTPTMLLSDAPSRAQRKVKHNTILYSSVRPNQKHYGILKNPKDNLIVSTGFITIDVKDEYLSNIDPYYLYTLLIQNNIIEYLQIIAENSTSAYPSILSTDIANLEFTFPSIKEQHNIANILFFLSQKIALNKAINHNLAAMAKQLYDYWFVQFDFPNQDGKPYKSNGGKMVWNEKLKREIPEGWEVIPLFEGIDVQYGFPFSTDSFLEETTDVPIVRIRDIINGTISAYSTEKIDEKFKLKKGDIVVGMDGNFHMNYWHTDKAYLNQRCVRLRPKKDSSISSIQIYYDIQPFIKAKEKSLKGSTVGHLLDKDLKELYILNSNTNLRNIFDYILLKILTGKIEYETLTKQRDELLPLLMNGQARIG